MIPYLMLMWNFYHDVACYDVACFILMFKVGIAISKYGIWKSTSLLALQGSIPWRASYGKYKSKVNVKLVRFL